MTSADATGQDAEHGLDEVVGRPENKDITVVERAHFNHHRRQRRGARSSISRRPIRRR